MKNKIIAIVAAVIIVVVIAAGILIGLSMMNNTPSGGDTSAKLTSEGDVSRTIDDVGSDISGISGTLDQIDSTFSDSNA